jgi:hypothetical protein
VTLWGSPDVQEPFSRTCSSFTIPRISLLLCGTSTRRLSSLLSAFT